MQLLCICWILSTTMSVQCPRGSHLVIQTINPAPLPLAHAPSQSSRVVINNIGQKRKWAQAIVTPAQTSLAECQPAESESLTIAPFNENTLGDVPLDVSRDACLQPGLEPMLSDAQHDDLILGSSRLLASDFYTRTSYWDDLVAANAVFRISTDLWVLQDWDGDEEALQV
jgi:hypothetical protein